MGFSGVAVQTRQVYCTVYYGKKQLDVVAVGGAVVIMSRFEAQSTSPQPDPLFLLLLLFILLLQRVSRDLWLWGYCCSHGFNGRDPMRTAEAFKQLEMLREERCVTQTKMVVPIDSKAWPNSELCHDGGDWYAVC